MSKDFEKLIKTFTAGLQDEGMKKSQAERFSNAFYAAYKAANISSKQGERFIYAFTGYMVASNPQNTGENQNGNSKSMDNGR